MFCIHIEPEQYLALIAEQPCAWCLLPGPSDPHHWPPRRAHGASDFRTLPLCRKHHNAFHARKLGNMNEQQLDEWAREQIVRLLVRVLSGALSPRGGPLG